MSRVEILTWVNQVTQLGLSKVEELGRGDALCQIFDSIYMDVPLKRVKFGAKHEFEYIQNFKVLQAVFDKHKIPNDIPVQRLVKLKFQDNIEFVQFVKKFWEQHFPGHAYDPIARRGGAGGAAVSHANPAAASKSMGPRVKSTSSPALGRTGSAAGHYSGGGMAGAVPSANAEALQQAQNQIMMLESQVVEAQQTVEVMMRERDFYFAKLRQVEAIAISAQEAGHQALPTADVLAIMYATDDGAAAGMADADAAYEHVNAEEQIESF